MKKLYFLFLTFLITSLSFGQMISEFEPNPAGGDPPDTTFELTGTATAAFDLWILSIENDGYNGLVDRATNVTGNFDANGRAVVMVPDLENPSFTVVLTDNFTGTTSTDIDPADDGTLDTSTFGTILDAVGVSDAFADDATMYGASLGGTDILYNGEFEPLLVFRDGTSGDWYQTVTVDFGGAGEHVGVFAASAGSEISTGDFDIDPTVGPTYGSVNPSNFTASTKDNQIEGFSLYPNPTSLGYVNLKSRNGNAFDVAVYDVLGKQVIKSSVTDGKLGVSSLNTGLYIMKVSQDEATVTKKLVIK
ncbi:T9SS type A sorting domain-containing protein [Yeosuana sp. MJ-SS3]|uniref:T9SS type A sorting domain-containing protein n=1 Tax=Gilvirhabdus luticola TaxID=3079858 RepID=A0ABU3U3G6_9FLAO|nr:T9SS type A sorting domain-containing protein [Yeosuana sp. MJ-SS3]MDU8884960.1 T9SS type A sorting domain-containing protein [Yeosuana sp. MJ-SS3]